MSAAQNPAGIQPAGKPVADTGFVYVATGDRYFQEAARSAATLRRFHPAVRICLITDRDRGDRFWDDLIVLDQPRMNFRDKLEMRRAPYSRAIFLDTDTVICGDVSSIFVVLTRYAVCGVQYCEGQDYEMEGGIPPAFPEMNGGIIGFRGGPETREFFELWARYYDEFRALNRDGYYHYANVGDQKSLRAALWHSQVRHAAIGAEFNFIPFKMELVSLPVAVLHTRARHNLDVLAVRLNEHLGRRAYVPALDAIVSEAMPRSELNALTRAVVRIQLRKLGTLLLPAWLRNWVRSRRGVAAWLFGNRFASPEGPDATSKWERPAPTRDVD